MPPIRIGDHEVNIEGDPSTLTPEAIKAIYADLQTQEPSTPQSSDLFDVLKTLSGQTRREEGKAPPFQTL